VSAARARGIGGRPLPDSASRRRRAWRAAGVLAIGCLVTAGAGCRRAGGDLSFTWTTTPAAPVVGEATTATVTVRDAAGQLVEAADLQVEAHMSHPGMAPVIAPAQAQGRGVYAAQLQFTMAGDWDVLVTGRLADGRRVRQAAAHLSVRAAN
jgi:hypothetical protein